MYDYNAPLVNMTQKYNKLIARKMFPGVAGSATYTVMATDYTKYAAVFTCQKLAFAHRRSATILSRTKELDRIYVDKVRYIIYVDSVYI